MKKGIIVFFSLVLLTISAAFAQPRGGNEDIGERYKAQKIAYITTEMELTPEESSEFWPLYNEYSQKKKDLLADHRLKKQAIKDNYNELTEAEAIEALQTFQNHMIMMNQLTIEYQNKYVEVLPAKKVLVLLGAEKDFRRKLLRELGNKRRGKR